VLRTLQCDLTDSQYGGPRSVTKTETFCAVNKSIGNPDITIQVSGLYDGDADQVHDVFYALWYETDPKLYKYGPGGSATGAVLLSGECWLTDYSISATAGGDVTVDATFEVQGNDHQSTW
jgi:hypothetical protein